MDNDALKQAFITLHPKITKEVNPDSIIDVLLSRKIISEADYCNLRRSLDSINRWRDLFSLLYRSTHSETFIILREVLLDECPQLVDEIDEQVASQSFQPQQPYLDLTKDGKLLCPVYNSSSARAKRTIFSAKSACTLSHFIM